MVDRQNVSNPQVLSELISPQTPAFVEGCVFLLGLASHMGDGAKKDKFKIQHNLLTFKNVTLPMMHICEKVLVRNEKPSIFMKDGWENILSICADFVVYRPMSRY